MNHKEVIKFGGIEVHYFLDANDTNKQLTMFKCVIPAGANIYALHYHESFDETVYGLKGIVTFKVDGKTIEITSGDYLFIPRGTVHGFANNTNEIIEFLCYASPGVFGPDYFHDLAEVIDAVGKPDMTKLKQVMLNHGLVAVAG